MTLVTTPIVIGCSPREKLLLAELLAEITAGMTWNEEYAHWETSLHDTGSPYLLCDDDYEALLTMRDVLETHQHALK